jgi:AAA15 family ATPase/GTPase
MSSSALQKLTISHLRGSVVPFALSFEKGKKLTIVYGENATGKTTICDAFEFLAHGRVGSLENRGLGKTVSAGLNLA